MAVIVLDASVVIAVLDAEDPHHRRAVAALEGQGGRGELVLPASAHAEVLVGPTRRGPGAVAAVDRFLRDLAVRVEPLGAEAARHAALLCARHPGLRLPDALVLATGDWLAAQAVLTADRAWLKVSRRARAV